MKRTFKFKLIFFTLSVTIIPLLFLVVLFLNNFNKITEVSLEQNTKGIKQSTYEYLTNMVKDKADLGSLRVQSVIDSVSVLGKSAQKIIDNYDELAGNKDIYEVDMFNNKLIELNGAKTNNTDEEVNVLIPPHIADNPESIELLKTTSLLNLSMASVFESNSNLTFLYFVGDRGSAITRAYPNIDVAHYLDSAGLLGFDFWADFFPDNVYPWEKFHLDKTFAEDVLSRTGTKTTFNQPYADAAGQGKIMTVFYPLWDFKENKFAGAVGADVSLASIVDTILSIHVAKTGYAFLVNGVGEIVAKPDIADKDLLTTEVVINRNGLDYYYSDLSTSKNESIKDIYKDIISNKNGYYDISLGNGEKGILTFDSIRPINSLDYTMDTWKIVIITPENEILETLIETHGVISSQNNVTTIISLIAVAITILIVILLTLYLSGNITLDITTLANAAKKISQKNYDISVKTKAKDEIGDLGNAFNLMSQEIKTYTENLEEKVHERTVELENAMEEIHALNNKLSDENTRMGAELDVAQKLQLMVLPSDEDLKVIKDLDIAGIMEPADEVGGDYYDVFDIEDSTIIGIGDVTGHGLSSGVVMLMAQTAIKTAASLEQNNLKKVLSTVNSVLYNNIERIKEDKTMTLSLIDYKDNEYRIVGQHETVIISRVTGEIEVIDTMELGFFVGLEEDIEDFISEIKVVLNPGDVMVLYTDGITEAVDSSEVEFGTDRLTESIMKYTNLSATEILNSVISDLKIHIGSSKIHDDISMIVVKQK